MTPDEKQIYDRGIIHGMTVAVTGMVGSVMHAAGIDGIPMLAGAMGKAFLPYLPHLERLDMNSMPRNIRKWCEILTDLANDVKARHAEAEPRIIE